MELGTEVWTGGVRVGCRKQIDKMRVETLTFPHDV